MIKSNFSKQKKIPNITTKKSSPVTTNFAKGMYTYKPNDTMGLDELLLAENARFDRIGEYGTRPGQKRLGVGAAPIGEASYKSSHSGSSTSEIVEGTSADYWDFYNSTRTALFSVKLTLYKDQSYTSEYIVPKVALYELSGTFAPPKLIAESCISSNDAKYNANTGNEHTFYFQNAPELKNGTSYRIKLETQTGDLSHLKVQCIRQLVSNTHVIWATARSATQGKIIGIFEPNIEGVYQGATGLEKPVLFAFQTDDGDTSLYWQSMSAAVAKIRDLPAGVTKVRFCQNLDTVRYVDGKEAPHLLTPTIGLTGNIETWADTAITPVDLETGTTLNITMSNIMTGPNDNILYFVSDPNTEMIWTYPYGYEYAKSPRCTTWQEIQGDVGYEFPIWQSGISPQDYAVGDWITGQGTSTAEIISINQDWTVTLKIVDPTPQAISSYDKFSTQFYQNFPAIKTGDPLTAMFNLGGVIYVQTRRNKYQMYSQTAESWTQSPSNAQGGTFSQESVVCDLNYAYYANDNGIYVFDGSSEASLTEGTIQNLYDAIPDKQTITLDLYKNRLYVYFKNERGTNSHSNDSCLVYNINLKVWESVDTNTFVSASCARQCASGRYICGHSKLGLVMSHESTPVVYADMGQPIDFNLETSYQHFGTTSQLKRITKWRPEFATAKEHYTCECGYALDFEDEVYYAFSIDLKDKSIVTWGYDWDSPSDFGVPTVPTKHTTIPRVNSEFYRCQIRYRHTAAFEPVIFRSHTLTVQTQRIR